MTTTLTETEVAKPATKLTELDVAMKALELADANPDFAYERVEGECLYVNRDTYGSPLSGSCLFGQALLALGVDPNRIPERVSIYSVLWSLGIAQDLDEMRHPEEMSELQGAMRNAQYMQDRGYRWGEAVGRLREVIEGQVGK